MKLTRIAAAFACATIAVIGLTMTSTAIAGPGHTHKMEKKAALGEQAPDFTLTDFNGN